MSDQDDAAENDLNNVQDIYTNDHEGNAPSNEVQKGTCENL